MFLLEANANVVEMLKDLDMSAFSNIYTQISKFILPVIIGIIAVKKGFNWVRSGVNNVDNSDMFSYRKNMLENESFADYQQRINDEYLDNMETELFDGVPYNNDISNSDDDDYDYSETWERPSRFEYEGEDDIFSP